MVRQNGRMDAGTPGWGIGLPGINHLIAKYPDRMGNTREVKGNGYLPTNIEVYQPFYKKGKLSRWVQSAHQPNPPPSVILLGVRTIT